MQVNAIDPGAIDPGVKLLKIDLLKQISRKRDAIRKEADSSTLRSYLSAVHGVVASGLDAQIKLEEAIELVVGLCVFLDELKYAPARNAFLVLQQFMADGDKPIVGDTLPYMERIIKEGREPALLSQHSHELLEMLGFLHCGFANMEKNYAMFDKVRDEDKMLNSTLKQVTKKWVKPVM